MKKKIKNELVVYNTNDPEKFTVIHCDGFTISEEQYQIIGAACGLGPYLAFFLDPCSIFIYRLRGPYRGIEYFYIIDSSHISFADKEEIRNQIMEKIKTIKENGGK